MPTQAPAPLTRIFKIIEAELKNGSARYSTEYDGWRFSFESKGDWGEFKLGTDGKVAYEMNNKRGKTSRPEMVKLVAHEEDLRSAVKFGIQKLIQNYGKGRVAREILLQTGL